MRMGRWGAIVSALAIAAVLALAGIATGSGSSIATFQFTPTAVPKTTFQKGKLSVHTHTNYTGGTATDRAQLSFDDDLKIDTDGIPRCNPSMISGNISLKLAMARCGDARVGTGRAQANAAVPGDAKGCVLAFNGRPSAGRPTLLLFTRVQAVGSIDCSNPANNTNGNVSVLLSGLIRSASGDFGAQLDVNNITTVATLPLSDFRVTVERGNYVSARCNDANREWNLRTRFTYVNPSGTQTVNDTQSCQVRTPPAPPNTRITKAKIKKKRGKAKFNFNATGQATGFQCQLKRKGHGSKPFRSCSSPKKYKRLKRGKYTFKVRAVGPGGKDPSPATKSFKSKRKRR
jgi:hypothetical protein